MIRKLLGFVVVAGVLTCPPTASAGSLYLTGHDVLLHDGQAGYDTLILDWLRGAGTASEVAASSYSIAVVGSGVGSWGWSDVPGFNDRGTKPGFGGTTYYDTDLMDETAWTEALSQDVLVILSHTSCGGCDLSDAGSAAVNARAAEIAAAFNAGMDIWGLSSGHLATYYDFLPPGAVATGAAISGSSGFEATAAGMAIGIEPSMINGYQTHNRFTSFSPGFSVFEVRPQTFGNEIISIGIRDATITDDGITPGDGDGSTEVPEPATAGLLALAVAVGAAVRRRRAR